LIVEELKKYLFRKVAYVVEEGGFLVVVADERDEVVLTAD
jgi:hypothetical protein